MVYVANISTQLPFCKCFVGSFQQGRAQREVQRVVRSASPTRFCWDAAVILTNRAVGTNCEVSYMVRLRRMSAWKLAQISYRFSACEARNLLPWGGPDEVGRCPIFSRPALQVLFC